MTSLLANASTWLGIEEKQYKRLDNIQYEFLRSLLQVPVSTPLACLRAATAVLGMKWRIWREKLLLVLAIRNQEEGVLAKEVFREQVDLGLPGLVQEVKVICATIGLPNVCICSPDKVNKKVIKEHIFYHHLKTVKEELGQLKVKGAELFKKYIRKPQHYFAAASLAEARVSFRIQNWMFDIPGRYLGRMGCDACLAWR